MSGKKAAEKSIEEAGEVPINECNDPNITAVNELAEAQGAQTPGYPPAEDVGDAAAPAPVDQETQFRNAIGGMSEGERNLLAKVLMEFLHDSVLQEAPQNEGVRYRLEDQLDRKFEFDAISKTSGTDYDESNAVVFLARDPALLYALDGYLTGCIALGADVNQIEVVKLLKLRVEKFQGENPVKLPGVETPEEMQRLS